MRRWQDGYPAVLTALEWLSWAQMDDEEVRDFEWQILKEMDKAFVTAAREEIDNNRAMRNGRS